MVKIVIVLVSMIIDNNNADFVYDCDHDHDGCGDCDQGVDADLGGDNSDDSYYSHNIDIFCRRGKDSIKPGILTLRNRSS